METLIEKLCREAEDQYNRRPVLLQVADKRRLTHWGLLAGSALAALTAGGGENGMTIGLFGVALAQVQAPVDGRKVARPNANAIKEKKMAVDVA